MNPRRLVAIVVAAVATLGACGADQPRELVGYQRDPAPQVGDLTLPDTTAGGADFALRAEPGHLLALYFGYTNCPDFCPTTLSNLRLAVAQLDEPDRVDVAMVSVDPDHDAEGLADYITGFFDRGHGLLTSDPDRLARVAAPLGVQYEVEIDPSGEVLVGHTTGLYLIDDQGTLLLTWQFGVPIDDLAADIEALLDGNVA